MSLRCLIVDDDAAFIEASQGTLEGEEINVVGTATTAAAALRRSAELRPDVVLVDISLGEESGLALARELARVADGARVILISTHPEEDFADLIAESPAAGFLPKSDLSADAIQELLSRD